MLNETEDAKKVRQRARDCLRQSIAADIPHSTASQVSDTQLKSYAELSLMRFCLACVGDVELSRKALTEAALCVIQRLDRMGQEENG